ncbi:MAG TPA: hypothetical protein VNU46_07250 [Gemmatimonadaceae bacterium]|nr:hypothetical protein [Gemmatimonadaceae bacterium]
MTTMHPDDERFAAFLRSAVPQLDVPSVAVPREEMWTRIMAQRHGHALLGLAAHESENTSETAEFTTIGQVAPSLASVPRAYSGRTISVWGQGIPVRWAVPMVAGVLVVGLVVGLQVGVRRVVSIQPQVAATQQLPKDVPAQVVAEQHFRNVEHLLTTFASYKATGKETPEIDAKVVAQARQLLSTTQLLLDSPVGLDAQRRHLLTDVELALMQITQLAPTGPAEDRDFVEHSIERSQVMERLQQQHPAPESQEQSESPSL